MLSSCCFVFFKQKTAYEMRISDWSSDVCSSDLFKLFTLIVARDEQKAARHQQRMRREAVGRVLEKRTAAARQLPHRAAAVAFREYRGRAPGRVIARLRFLFQNNDA